MNQRIFMVFLLGLWTDFERDYRNFQQNNQLEDEFENATIHTFIKWLKWKQKQP